MEVMITAEKAAENRILIKEDMEKYELAKAHLAVQMAQYDAMIRECRLALADIDRLEAGVEYPKQKDAGTEQPKEEQPKAEQPTMGQPVGGK